MSIPDITLNNGNKIPQLGLGTWQIKDQDVYNKAFKAAVKVGYRHFDTAQAYGNEQFLGKAWVANGLKRSDIFITTKIDVRNFTAGRLRSSFEQSLDELRTEYVDLLLLHFPVPVLRKNAWKVLQTINKSGAAKNIGVSNYTVKHLEDLKTYAKILPAINQVELHVFLQQPELIDYCKDHGIQVEAYCPLARAKIMDNPAITEIAKTHHKSYAQVMIRWLIEQDLVVIPKSTNPARIKENFNVYDFKLDKDDMDKLARQDQEMRVCWSPVHIP
jgi:methylglyoxal/glyoxal reductase